MLGRLRQLFQRYGIQHLDLRKPGYPLHDEFGHVIGWVDYVRLRGNHLQVEGWAEAGRVALIQEGARLEVVPHLPRPDVAEARQDPDAVHVGFSIEAPYRPGPGLLSVEVDTLRYLHPVPGFRVREIRRGRLALLPAFARDLVRASPAILRWLATRDPALRGAVKSALRFGPDGPVLAMASDLFQPSSPEDLPEAPITIVLPVYNAFDLLSEVLDRVQRNTDLPWRLVVIEDRSSDQRVRPWLRDWVAASETEAPGRVHLIENQTNQGFIRSVNAGFAKALEWGDHVVLLNSDAFLPEGWASRLIRPILTHDNVASVTPMSNDAEIFTVPSICKRTVLEPGEADRIDAVARCFHPDAELAAAPTGVGFCMAINIDHLRAQPEFDTAFGRGYGEEVDWCQKIRARGGRHLGLPGLFVEHRGGTSFGSAEKLRLVQKNNAIIARRYTGYDREVQNFIAHDPLATPRLALAIAWAAGRQDTPMPVFLAHAIGGGAERYVAHRIAQEIEGGRSALVLRVGGGHRWQVECHGSEGVIRGVTNDFEFIKRLLEPVPARRIVYSCAVGDPDPVDLPGRLLDLARGPQDSIEVLFHDFFPISPSYCLLGADGRFHGVPHPGQADAAHRTRRPDGSRVSLKDWQAAWGRLIDAADKVVVFSADSRTHVLEAYPQADASLRLCPHRLLVEVPRVALPAPRTPPVIGVLGNIGYQKGAQVLADLSRQLADTGAAQLVLVGNIDPAFELVPPAVIHGDYRVEHIPSLIARYGIGCWLIPSIWPETFSYATHEALATGLPVFCFDLGAQAEAVRAAPNGTVLPLGAGPVPVSDLVGSGVAAAALTA